jgi:hypothetical protein
MVEVMWMYYIGLGMFMLNSIIWMGQRNERVVAKVREERLKQLLTRANLRNRRR